MVVRRIALTAILFAGTLVAQSGRAAWWDQDLAQDVGLTTEQRGRIRSVMRDFRPRLLRVRAEVNRAETELEQTLNAPQIDESKANAAIQALGEARGNLVKAVSEMNLRLRQAVTADQWAQIRTALRRKPDAQ